ncbi:putative aminoacrylate hydrolase RutD [Diplonema papillatum]|nr:putative aminoacrylate hydrolase RutD [Diplonema papillatum]
MMLLARRCLSSGGAKGVVSVAIRRASSEPAQERRWKELNIGEAKIAVVETGPEDGTPVLCMPGALGTAETDFSGQLDDLPEHGFRVISFDPRGYGKSRPPTRTYPPDFYHIDANDAATIMESLGIQKYSVMGWSDGANAAVILAANHPDAVARLVMFGGNSYITQEDIDAYEATRDVATKWSAGMKAKHVPVYGRDLQPMWDSFCDAMLAIYRTGGVINKDEAKLIKCPTLIVHGKKDPIVPLMHAEWYHKNIPGASVYYFEEGKHNIHIKYRLQFNALVSTFLSFS